MNQWYLYAQEAAEEGSDAIKYLIGAGVAGLVGLIKYIYDAHFRKDVHEDDRADRINKEIREYIDKQLQEQKEETEYWRTESQLWHDRYWKKWREAEQLRLDNQIKDEQHAKEIVALKEEYERQIEQLRSEMTGLKEEVKELKEKLKQYQEGS